MLSAIISAAGPVGILIIGVLLFTLLLAVERIQALMFRYSLDAPAFLDQLENLLGARNLDRARKLVQLHARAPLARIGEAVISAVEEGDGAVQRALDWSVAEQRMVVMTRVGWFKPLGIIAALLGIAGAGLAAASVESLAYHGFDPWGLEGAWMVALKQGGGAVFAGFMTAALCFAFHLILGSYARRMALFLEVGAKRLRQTELVEAPAERAVVTSPQ